MKDIANDLGLSVVTVSKVFRGHHDIGEETRQRVLARIKELNYQPNLAARSLATGRSYFMGLIVPDLMHPFFSEVAKHLASVIRAKGYTLLLSVSDENTSIEKSEVDYLLSRRVDVLLLASSMPGNATVPAVTESEVPVILIDRCFDGMNANFVGVDDELVGRIATQHLIDQDCKRIAIITAGSSTGGRRLAGYQQALQAAGLPVDPGLIAMREHGDDDADETGYAAMKQLLASGAKPDGVFCHNDPAAMGAMQAILEAGLRIPQDIAVDSCGNVRYAKNLRVPLTSVDQNCKGIGEEAGKMALALADKPGRRPRTVMLEPRLVVRESSLRRRR